MGFNREVALDAAVYWNKNKDNLARLIDEAEKMSATQIEELGTSAKKRIAEAYSWRHIANLYKNVFMWKKSE